MVLLQGRTGRGRGLMSMQLRVGSVRYLWPLLHSLSCCEAYEIEEGTLTIPPRKQQLWGPLYRVFFSLMQQCYNNVIFMALKHCYMWVGLYVMTMYIIFTGPRWCPLVTVAFTKRAKIMQAQFYGDAFALLLGVSVCEQNVKCDCGLL